MSDPYIDCYADSSMDAESGSTTSSTWLSPWFEDRDCVTVETLKADSACTQASETKGFGTLSEVSIFITFDFFSKLADLVSRQQTPYAGASTQSLPVNNHLGNNELDLRKAIQMVELHRSNSSLCCDEDAVYFLGNTGAGKSTTVNYLAGRRIVTVRDADNNFFERYDVENPLDGCTVGYTGNSETRYLRSYLDPSSTSRLVLCDTPGFEDTEGSDVDIANAVAIAWAIRHSKSVRLVLIVESSSILSTRGNELSKLFTLFKRFLINIEENLDSVS